MDELDLRLDAMLAAEDEQDAGKAGTNLA